MPYLPQLEQTLEFLPNDPITYSIASDPANVVISGPSVSPTNARSALTHSTDVHIEGTLLIEPAAQRSARQRERAGQFHDGSSVPTEQCNGIYSLQPDVRQACPRPPRATANLNAPVHICKYLGT